MFNPNVSSYKASSLSSLYRRFEKEKQRKYEQHICEMEMGCFTPLVFSTFGGMSTISLKFFSRDLPPCLLTRGDVVMSWFRCRVSFSLLRSAIDCLRGAWLFKGHAAVSLQAFDLALSEGRMSLNH